MVNTNCDICGGSLLQLDEIKEGVHKRCYEEWKETNEVKKMAKVRVRVWAKKCLEENGPYDRRNM